MGKVIYHHPKCHQGNYFYLKATCKKKKEMGIKGLCDTMQAASSLQEKKTDKTDLTLFQG